MQRVAGPGRGRARPARRLIAAVAALAATAASCTSNHQDATAGSPPRSTAAAAPPRTPIPVTPDSPSASASPEISIAPGDRAACGVLFGHLQQVTAGLNASSELIASAQDKTQLSQRIADEQRQLQQSATLMASGPIPPPLAAADHELVAALRAFTADFARAKAPAARGDFQAAAQAMTDKAVVGRIIEASKTIEDACT